MDAKASLLVGFALLLPSCASSTFHCGDYRVLRLQGESVTIAASGNVDLDGVELDSDIPLEQILTIGEHTVLMETDVTAYGSSADIHVVSVRTGEQLRVEDFRVDTKGERNCYTFWEEVPFKFSWIGGAECGTPNITLILSDGASVKLDFTSTKEGRYCVPDAL